MKGRRVDGADVTLIESVRQDRRRGLTIFQEHFVESRRGRTRHRRFFLTFRTQPLPRLLARLERAGIRPEVMPGDYRGGPLEIGSETWLILGRKQ